MTRQPAPGQAIAGIAHTDDNGWAQQGSNLRPLVCKTSALTN